MMTKQHDAPEGGTEWKLVPVKPSVEQIAAVSPDCFPETTYGLMLAAAPTPPAPSGLAGRTLVAQMEQTFGSGSVAAWDGSDEKAIVGANATLSGQLGGAVPAGDLPGLKRALQILRHPNAGMEPPDGGSPSQTDRVRNVAEEIKELIARLAEQPAPAGKAMFGAYVFESQTTFTRNELPISYEDVLGFLNAEQPVRAGTFQARVKPWVVACFGDEVACDVLERQDRFVEEALELVQSLGYDRKRVAALTDYVFGREPGEPPQEIGGTMMTLAALCNAIGEDMHQAGEAELARVWTKVDKIRAKQAAKPKGSALPVAMPAPAGTGDADRAEGLRKAAGSLVETISEAIAVSYGTVTQIGNVRWAEILRGAKTLRAALDGASGQGEGAGDAEN